MADVDQAVADLRQQGYHIARNVLPAELCDELCADLARMQHSGVKLNLKNEFHGFKSQRYHDLLNQGEVWQRLACDPNLLPVAQGLLGADCLLNIYGTSIFGPGEKEQPMHVDDANYIGASRALRERPRMQDGSRESLLMNCMVALTDFTAENGATHLVPKSNQMEYPSDPGIFAYPFQFGEEDSARLFKQSVQAVMPRGSVLFWDGQTYHAGGANRTNQSRIGVIVEFCAGHLRQTENFIVACGEKVERFPAALQALVGYKISKYGVGFIYTDEAKGIARKIKLKSYAAEADDQLTTTTVGGEQQQESGRSRL